MIKTPKSPFEEQKWESDKEKIIWLPPIFEQWEGKNCVYITGSRGTGKTTLLKGLIWDQRMFNQSLKIQSENYDPFEKKYIGVYLNIPDWNTRHFLNWPMQKENTSSEQWEEERARVFSLYLEYGILENFINAIQNLRSRNLLQYSTSDEQDCIKKIVKERYEIQDFFSGRDIDYSISELRLYFKKMYENIRRCAINCTPLEPSENYPYLQMGKLLEEITYYLLILCSKTGYPNNDDYNFDNKWNLKVCLDSMESFYPYQQKAVNTIVARRENVSFVIASLDGYIDINSTFVHEHSLTNADRSYYPLDQIYSDEHSTDFDQFINEVTRLRFAFLLKDTDMIFNVQNILGNSNLNNLLDPILKKSQNVKVKRFIDEAQKFESELKKCKILPSKNDRKGQSVIGNQKTETGGSIAPYIEYYIVKKLGLKLPIGEKNNEKIKSFFSQNFRKKQVAAVLCLCKEYDQKIPFGGYSIIRSLSDSCIRDYLSQMNEIFITQNVPADKFITSHINPSKQGTSLKKASKNRFIGITNTNVEYSNEVQRLVEGLGKITSVVQSDYFGGSSLKTIERGKFVVDLSTLDEESAEKLQLILSAARHTCCIKVIDENKNENRELIGLTFRLHNLFAPNFEFSYRGAESKLTMDAKDLLNICLIKNKKERISALDKISSKLIKIQRKEMSVDVQKLEKWMV